jgi:hypothetical protein
MIAQRTASGSLLRAAIVLLTLGTAVTHLLLNFPDPVFILNGLGYLGLLGALYLPIPIFARHRRLIRRVLIGYTALTIFLWMLFGARTPIGYVNKLNELALIVLLVLEGRRDDTL